MRKRSLTSLPLLISLVFICTHGAHAQQGRDRQLVQTASPASSNAKRIALVIGNGSYAKAPTLKNPTNDATDIAEALSKLGFSVDHGVDLSQRQMKAMIREFGQKLRGGGQGLFYFAGHGIQMRGHNYLIPVDADIQSETDVEDQGVDANLVMGLMDEAGNGLNVVILDACRNNPFSRSFRSASNGLAQMDAPSGTLIAYATSPGSVASDGSARNGLYTQELLKFMRTPNLSIEEVFKQVRISVRNQTQNKQTPWESSSLIGDFYFTTSGETVKSKPQTPAPAPQPQTSTSNAPKYNPQQEVGTYRGTSNVAVIDFIVTFENGKLILTVVGQGTVPLENVGGRRYKIVTPTGEGHLTFRPVNGDESKTEILLEQRPPMSNFVLVKIQ